MEAPFTREALRNAGYNFDNKCCENYRFRVEYVPHTDELHIICVNCGKKAAEYIDAALQWQVQEGE